MVLEPLETRRSRRGPRVQNHLAVSRRRNRTHTGRIPGRKRLHARETIFVFLHGFSGYRRKRGSVLSDNSGQRGRSSRADSSARGTTRQEAVRAITQKATIAPPSRRVKTFESTRPASPLLALLNPFLRPTLQFSLGLAMSRNQFKIPPPFPGVESLAHTSPANKTSCFPSLTEEPHKRRICCAFPLAPKCPCVLARSSHFSRRGRIAFRKHSTATGASGKVAPRCIHPSALLRSKSHFATYPSIVSVVFRKCEDLDTLRYTVSTASGPK